MTVTEVLDNAEEDGGEAAPHQDWGDVQRLVGKRSVPEDDWLRDGGSTGRST
jgi:hypothetical protein